MQTALQMNVHGARLGLTSVVVFRDNMGHVIGEDEHKIGQRR